MNYFRPPEGLPPEEVKLWRGTIIWSCILLILDLYINYNTFWTIQTTTDNLLFSTMVYLFITLVVFLLLWLIVGIIAYIMMTIYEIIMDFKRTGSSNTYFRIKPGSFWKINISTLVFATALGVISFQIVLMDISRNWSRLSK